MAKDMYQKRRERKEKAMSNDSTQQGCQKNIINWYPGHMAKTKREIKEMLNTIDVVIEVVDARVPISSHIEDLNSFVNDKITIIVFNKYDLCDKEKTKELTKYYENMGYKVIYCNSKDMNDYKNIVSYINVLMQEVNKKRSNKGLLAKKPRVLIVGVPNVGKSTLINRIAGKNMTVTGNKPGVTKNLGVIKTKEFDLIDSPGILWPKIKDEETALNLASMNIIKTEVLPIDKVAIHILNKLNKDYKNKLKENFNIDEIDEDIVETYNKISDSKKIAKYDNETDYDKVSELVINALKNDKINGITFDNIK